MLLWRPGAIICVIFIPYSPDKFNFIQLCWLLGYSGLDKSSVSIFGWRSQLVAKRFDALHIRHLHLCQERYWDHWCCLLPRHSYARQFETRRRPQKCYFVFFYSSFLSASVFPVWAKVCCNNLLIKLIILQILF